MAHRLFIRIQHLIGPRHGSSCPSRKNSCLTNVLISPFLTSGFQPKYSTYRYVSSDPQFDSVAPVRALQDAVELENTYAFKALLNRSQNFGTVLSSFSKRPNKTTQLDVSQVKEMTWTDSTPKLLEQFQFISEKHKPDGYSLSHELFTPMTEGLIGRVKEMTDEEIFQVLRNLACWPIEIKANSGNYYNLIKAMDQECVMRLRSWSRPQILHAVLHWYLPGLARGRDCVYLGLKKVARKPHSLTPSELTQLMFFLNVTRSHHPTVKMLEIEWKMYHEINNLSIQELGIICLGFFKSQTTIKEPKLVNKIIDRFVKSIDIAHSYTVTSILKCLRYSTRYQSFDYVAENLIPILAKHIDRYPFVACVHIAYLLVKCNISNDEILKVLAQKLKENLKTARIKEVMGVTGSLASLNYKCAESPNIYELSLDEMRSPERQTEIMEHPKLLSLYLSKVAFVEMYPEDLLSKAFSHEFLVHCFGKRLSRFSVPTHYLQLHYGVKIEAPSYQGPLLTPELESSMSHQAGWFLVTERCKSMPDKLIWNMYCQLSDLLGGREFAKIIRILPPFMKPDIIFCLDKETGQPLPIPEDVNSKAYLQGTLPSTEGEWHCIFGAGEFGHCYSTGASTGYMRMRGRLLTKIGYKAHFSFLPFKDHILVSEEEQLDVIKKIINYSKYEQIWKTKR